MKTFEIEARVYMKDYNREKYWIDRDCMGTHTIDAETAEQALQIFAQMTRDGDEYFGGVEISENAMKKSNRAPFWRGADEDPTGIVVTGKTEIWDRSANVAGSVQYVDCFLTVYEIDRERVSYYEIA